MKSWYYAKQGVTSGALSLADLQLALARGDIDRGSLVWTQGMPEWQPLAEVEELRPLLASSSSATPPQPLHLPPSGPPPVPGAPMAGATEPAARGHGRDRAFSGSLPAPPSSRSRRRIEHFWRLLRLGLRITLRSRLGLALLALVALMLLGMIWKAGAPRITSGGSVAEESSRVLGLIRIDANPWGQVDWIRDSYGSEVELPQQRSTPFVLHLPVGKYEARVVYPHGARPFHGCELDVVADRTAVCWLDLAPVTSASYFQRIGW